MTAGRSPATTVPRVVALLASYGAVVVALTWPLARDAASDLPRIAGGIGADQYYLGWALAWQTHALATAPSALPHANVYWPAPLALFYGTPGFSLLPAFALPFLATGNPTLALNVALLTAHVLTALAVHWVTMRWTDSHAAGFAAAVAYLTSSATLTLCAMLPQYAAMAAVPLVLWLVVEGGLSARRTALLAVLIAAQSLTDVAYVGPPLFLTLGMVAAFSLCVRETRPDGRAIVLACVAAALLLAPVYAGYLAVRAANPDIRMQTTWNVVGQQMPFAFGPATWLPPRGPLVLDAWIFVPVALGLAATLAGATRAGVRRRRAWAVAGVVFVVGAAIAWWIPRRFPAFRELAATTVARDPLRFGHGALVAACLLVGLGVSACVETAQRFVPPAFGRAVVVAVLLAFLAGRIAWMPTGLGAYPTLRAEAPGGEAPVLRDGAGPVLAVFGAKLGSLLQAKAMYRSVAHWRPLLNGYSSYFPAGFPERMRLAERLPDAEALATLRRDAGLTTLVVHSGGLPALTFAPWLRAVESGTLPDVRVRYRDAEALVLAVGPGG